MFIWVRGGVLVLLAFVLTTRCSTAPITPTNTLGTTKKQTVGCSVAVNEYTRSVFYEPLIIVGEREGLDEDHQPVQEWWVWYPNRPVEEYTDANGKLRSVNVPKYKVLLQGEVRLIKGVTCRCPW